MSATFCVRLSLAIGVAMPLVGCGKGDECERIDVSGRVSYRGEPVETGTITFDPQASGPVAVTRIANGTYEATGVAGVPVGAYTIRISATVEDRANWVEGAMPEPPRKELLPARYNLQSNLTREVPTGARAMEMDFMLE